MVLRGEAEYLINRGCASNSQCKSGTIPRANNAIRADPQLITTSRSRTWSNQSSDASRELPLPTITAGQETRSDDRAPSVRTLVSTLLCGKVEQRVLILDEAVIGDQVRPPLLECARDGGNCRVTVAGDDPRPVNKTDIAATDRRNGRNRGHNRIIMAHKTAGPAPFQHRFDDLFPIEIAQHLTDRTDMRIDYDQVTGRKGTQHHRYMVAGTETDQCTIGWDYRFINSCMTNRTLVKLLNGAVSTT